MKPPLLPSAVVLFRPPLTVPVLAEQRRAQQEKALDAYLAEFCDRLEAQDDERPLSEAQFKHVTAIRQALGAVLAYDQTTDELLAHYRAALEAGQQLAAAQVPTLEQALSPDWQTIALRTFDRLAPHLPPRTPTPLEARISRFLAQPHLQARLALPLDERRALAGITSKDLPNGPERR